ncbi:DET1 homolog [Teleopsis dalmanni]|uniref:DET1 homolog n=1 Tax=Teleopsis dalmanni TaxID=139649 RepID=UPI0018CC8FA9|nr:DET1 homolog [Teleopsis dalmanni]
MWNPYKIPTRKYSQNLQHHLTDRESGYKRRHIRSTPCSDYLYFEREFHKSILPNLTIQNVDRPLGFIRKFSPNGKLLLSFSNDKRSLEVWKYAGVGHAAELFKNEQGECITAADQSLESLRIRQEVFKRLFTLRSRIHFGSSVTHTYGQLNREFSIFLENGRYVLLAAVTSSHDELPFRIIFTYPDIYPDCSLCNYTFFLVDLEKDCVVDTLLYNKDHIMLSHHHGVSVYNHTIAILSKLRQCIEVVELVNGKLVRLQTIGPFANDMDEARVPIPDCVYMGALPLTHLKQRILAHIYTNIFKIESAHLRKRKLLEFYKFFQTYEDMVILKMQLLDVDHLLIRYEKRPRNVNVQDFKLYVFYCISKCAVMRVFSRSSIELLYLLRNFCDNFRNVRSLQSLDSSSSSSNNAYYRAAFNNAIASVNGGVAEAAMRFNPTLPISSQSFSTAQYLDYNLFCYDDQLISALERPKLCSREPIRFTDRNTNITKFRLFLETSVDLRPNHQLVTFIFHPFEPFIISVQKLYTRYVTNFHIYNQSTIVTQ